MGLGFVWLAICRLCGHQAIVKGLMNAKIELNRHYHYCHKNVKPKVYDENVTVIKIREDTAMKILYPALVIAKKNNRKPIIKISL
jgi:hypothetical protein